MKALIRCTLCLSKTEIDEMSNNEDEFLETWGQVKYYLETVQMVKWS